VEQRRAADDPGRVDHTADRADCLSRPLRSRVDFLDSSNIDDARDSTPIGELACYELDGVGSHVPDRDPTTDGDERARGGEPDPRGPAGDDHARRRMFRNVHAPTSWPGPSTCAVSSNL